MKLTDTQAQILAAAAAHPHGLALPPDRLPAAARQTVGKALLKAGLVNPVPEPDDEAPGALWSIDGEGLVLRITEVGLRALGAGPAAEISDVAAANPGKEDTPQEPPGAPLTLRTIAEAPDTAEAAEAAQESARAVLGASGRRSLRVAATAVVAAWDATPDRAGMEDAIAALRATLAGKPARAAREPGAPRKPREGTKQQQVLAMLRRTSVLLFVAWPVGDSNYRPRQSLAGVGIDRIDQPIRVAEAVPKGYPHPLHVISPRRSRAGSIA